MRPYTFQICIQLPCKNYLGEQEQEVKKKNEFVEKLPINLLYISL